MSLGAQESRAIGWKACIAQRGADRLGLSFGADLGAIFDTQAFASLFRCARRFGGDMRKKAGSVALSLWMT